MKNIVSKVLSFVTMFTLVFSSFGLTVAQAATVCTPNDAQTIVSDTDTQEGSPLHNSVAVSLPPSEWTTISGATWIWGEDPIASGSDLTETFTRDFEISGTPQDSTLDIATDNSASVDVNGNSITFSGDNFTSAESLVIPAGDLQTGTNTLTITVTNFGENNPAGLLYKLVLNSCTPVAPDPTPVTGTGSITVCKVIEDSEGDVVAGDAGTTFTVPFLDASYEGTAVNPIPASAVFDTPLSLNTHLDIGVEGNNAECITYDDLTPGIYYYGQEEISSGDWQTPRYNDQFDMTVSNLDDLLPFDVGNTNDNVDGVINLQADQSRTLVVLNQESTTTNTTVNATKIVCPTEDLLPNWGNFGPDVTSTTASDFITAHPTCHLEDWDFAWSLDGVGNPGDQTLGTGGAGWNGFSDSSVTTIPAGQRIWFREQPQANYIPFSGATSDLDSVASKNSAEFDCASDVLNYDNWEFIDTVAGQHYNCVAFNVPTTTETTTGTLIVKKVVVNGGDALPSDFSFSIDNGTSTAFSNDPNGTTVVLSEGTHTVVESPLPQDWNLSVQCVYENLPAGNSILNGESVNIDSDNDVTCTFTNTFIGGGNESDTGTLTVTKVVENGDSDTPKQVSDFPLFVDGNLVISGVSNVFSSGSHAVTETNLPDYTGVFSGDCDVNGSVTIPADGSAECILTNTFTPDGDGGSGPFTLTITTSGEGNGKVLGQGIDCDTNFIPTEENPTNDCTETYPSDTNVDLTVTLDEGSNFDGTWSTNSGIAGTCTGNSTSCQVTLNSGNPSTSLNAHFALNTTTTHRSSARHSGGGGGGTPQGQVLGAATDVCNLSIDTYMRKGYQNNVDEVETLQNFLNGEMNLALRVDGVYGASTEAAVSAFQIKYKDEILTPWNLTAPTGIFYKTTLVKAKNLMCPITILPIPTDLIPWSLNPTQVPPKA